MLSHLWGITLAEQGVASDYFLGNHRIKALVTSTTRIKALVTSTTGCRGAPGKDAASSIASMETRLLASLQALQQIFRVGYVGEHHTRADQALEQSQRVCGPPQLAEGNGEVILDVGVLGGRNARGAQVYQRLFSLALGHQDPSQRVIDQGCRRSSSYRFLGQFARFRQVTLLLIKPGQIVQRRCVARAVGNDAGVFSNGVVVFLLLEIERG